MVITTYKIVLKNNSLNFYVDETDDEKVVFALREIKDIISIFFEIVKKVYGKLPYISNVVFSKGYEIINESLIPKISIGEGFFVDEDIRISVKYEKKADLPLLIHSFFAKEFELNNIFDNINSYINRLYNAKIEIV